MILWLIFFILILCTFLKAIQVLKLVIGNKHFLNELKLKYRETLSISVELW